MTLNICHISRVVLRVEMIFTKFEVVVSWYTEIPNRYQIFSNTDTDTPLVWGRSTYP